MKTNIHFSSYLA